MLTGLFCTTIPLLCATHIQNIGMDEVYCIQNGILVFRGTLSSNELLHEMRVGQYNWRNGGTVHRGFADMYEKIRPKVLKDVKKYRPHTIAGHSLGGVMAIMCAIDMVAELDMEPRNTITFGAPRIGNSEFAQNTVALVPNIVRIVNDNDFVTRLPPLCVHVGVTTVRFQGDDNSVLRNHALPTYCDALSSKTFTVESNMLHPHFTKLCKQKRTWRWRQRTQ